MLVHYKCPSTCSITPYCNPMVLMPENFHQRNDKRIMRQLENGKTLKLPNKFGQILTLLMTS